MIPALMDFAGRWRLARRIDDRRAGAQGRLAGQAVLSPDGAGLTFREAGTLVLPGIAPMQASRTYLWRTQAEEIAVFFEDGRRFHVIGAAVRDIHRCDPDSYAVRYDFSRWPDWSAVWEVTGPRKDYRMESHYSRA